MTKYAKYIILLVLAVICMILIWYIFMKPNDELTKYMDDFSKQTQQIQQNVEVNGSVIDNNEEQNNITEVGNGENEKENQQNQNQQGQDGDSDGDKENNQQLQKDPPSVILTSDSEMLNKQGEELLKQISQELEKSILTIQQSTGVVEDEVLQK